MGHLVVRVTDFASDEFSQCMAILGESIAPSAQLPRKRLLELLAADDYQLFSFSADEEVAAISLVYFSRALPLAWLDYMAVRSDLRGRGLGSGLFRGILDIAANRNADWLLLEVDDDRHGTSNEVRTNKRRIAFYGRLGAQLLTNVQYWFPSPAGPPLPMRLMARALRAQSRLSPDYLCQAVEEIFSNVHGRSRDDELLRRFRSSLPDEIELVHVP